MKKLVAYIGQLSQMQILILFGLVGILLFGKGLSNEMVLDDWNQIVDNRLIHSLQYIPKLFAGSTFYSGSTSELEGLYYRPLMLSSFAVIYNFFGDSTTPYRLLQLGLHVANALLIYVLLKKYVRNIYAIGAGLLFLVHPLVVETVVYISNLQDVLFTFFGLLSSLVLMKDNLEWKSQLALSWAMLFLALLSKEIAVIFIVANAGYLWASNRKEWRHYVLLSMLLFVAYGLFRVFVLGLPDSDTVYPIADTTIVERLQTWPKMQAYYLRMLVFPKEMAIAQYWVVRKITIVDFWQPLLITVIVWIGFAWVVIRTYAKKVTTRPLVIYSLGLIVSSVLIHSQLFPLTVTVADRWYYTTLLGLLLLLSATFDIFVKKMSTSMVIIFLGMFLLLFARSFVRVEDWKTGFSLYSHDYQFVEDSFTLENNLGLEYLKQGEYELAQKHLEQSVTLSPEWGISWNNLGLVYESMYNETGNSDYLLQAEEAYLQAIDFPSGVSPFVNLSRVMLQLSHRTIAEKLVFVDNALSLYPTEADLWYVKSYLHLELGNKKEAIESARQLVRLNPTAQSKQWLELVMQSIPEQF